MTVREFRELHLKGWVTCYRCARVLPPGKEVWVSGGPPLVGDIPTFSDMCDLCIQEHCTVAEPSKKVLEVSVHEGGLIYDDRGRCIGELRRGVSYGSIMTEKEYLKGTRVREFILDQIKSKGDPKRILMHPAEYRLLKKVCKRGELVPTPYADEYRECGVVARWGVVPVVVEMSVSIVCEWE